MKRENKIASKDGVAAMFSMAVATVLCSNRGSYFGCIFKAFVEKIAMDFQLFYVHNDSHLYIVSRVKTKNIMHNSRSYWNFRKEFRKELLNRILE